MTVVSSLISKSKYLIGLQCPKYLWMCYNSKHKIPEPDEQQQHIFEQGHEVGEFAKKLFPKGIDISFDNKNISNNIEQTKILLKKRKPLFEAAFSTVYTYSRADILNPVGKDEWDIIEVKSATEVKDVNIQDVSFQKYVYEQSGLKIRKCFIMVLNNEYIKKGKINPKKLFKKEDVTDKVNESIVGIQDRIADMLRIISSKEFPKTKVSLSCKDPYECPLEEDCWAFLPKHNIFDLYRIGKRSFELFEKEIHHMNDIPVDFKLNDKQQIQCACVKSGKPHMHKESIKHFLKTLKYPLYYLDFETYATAIPLYDSLKPYQQIPFQFSLHVVQKKGAKPKHLSFLASGKSDPRPKFASALKKVIKIKGTIVVYNASFEKHILKQLADFLPRNKKWIQLAIDRVEDLLIPFRNFSYYHPEQHGSASIKKVLPALTGQSYKDMEIAEGGAASLHYFYITHGFPDGRKTTKKESQKVRVALEKYCGLDTEGMVWIVSKLEKIVK